MSMNMPPPSAMPPSAPPANDPFPEELIMQICQETGYTPERVKADIARAGVSTKEELYPQFYSGQGIEPPQGETVAPGMVQGQMPPDPGMAQMPPGAPAMAPPEAGEPPQSASAEGIDPAVMQQLHDMMRPKKR